eukprot:scaffold676373_cov60-Prasinocladus_malaysianus.AAC.1
MRARVGREGHVELHPAAGELQEPTGAVELAQPADAVVERLAEGVARDVHHADGVGERHHRVGLLVGDVAGAEDAAHAAAVHESD